MHVIINGEGRDIPEGLTVKTLLEHLDLAKGPVAVEINREIVPRANHASQAVSQGDAIEIVHFVGGG